jgi:hypothetical protein
VRADSKTSSRLSLNAALSIEAIDTLDRLRFPMAEPLAEKPNI